MRERLYTIISKGVKEDRVSKLYDVIICIVILLSMTPLMFRTAPPIIDRIDTITFYLLVLDYTLRWSTADHEEGKPGKITPFFRYPFKLMSLIALAGIIPSMGIINSAWRVLRIFRMFSLMHYSSQLNLVKRVIQRQMKTLILVFGITLTYIFMVALIVFNYHPYDFNNFFRALAWAVTTLTSVSYTTVQPTSVINQAISIMSSLVGVGIIALPTGIITSGFMEVIREDREKKARGEGEEEHTFKRFVPRIHPPGHISPMVWYVGIIIFCIVLNKVGYTVTTAFRLPLWLDTIGTMIAAVLLEPMAGVLVGFVNNMMIAINMGNQALLYFTISVMVAIVTGNLLVKKKKIEYSRFIPVMLLVIVLSSVMSYLIYRSLLHANNGTVEAQMSYWETAIKNYFLRFMPIELSRFLALFIVKIPDNVVCFAILFGICKAVDKRKAAAGVLEETDRDAETAAFSDSAEEAEIDRDAECAAFCNSEEEAETISNIEE